MRKIIIKLRLKYINGTKICNQQQSVDTFPQIHKTEKINNLEIIYVDTFYDILFITYCEGSMQATDELNTLLATL